MVEGEQDVGDGCDETREEEGRLHDSMGDETHVIKGQTCSTAFVALGS
jgi:hypothetical protein